MIISEKQIFKLMAIAHNYIELISLIQMEGIKMNYPDKLKEQAGAVLREIRNQQPEELKLVEKTDGYVNY